MWLLFIFFAALSAIVAFSGTNDYLEREKPVAARQGDTAAANLRAFAWAAFAYMQANPSTSGAVTWATIKASPAIPEPLKNANFNPNWKLVADGAGAWVVCAEIPDAALGSLSKVVPDQAKRFTSADGNKLVFAASQGQVETEAAKCN